MSGFKDIVKGGWHPEKNSSSSGDGGRLGKVKGLMGRGGEAKEDPHTHQSAPLSTLVDPASFGPPPKHVHYYGAAAAQGSRPPPPAPRRSQPQAAAPTPGAKPKPSLPPRLPPRQNSNPHEYTPEPPPSYSETTQPLQGELNQGALNRLGQAGVSVPAFGIGRTASPPVPRRQTASPVAPAPAPAAGASQMGELQSRFSRMSTPSSQPASTGTTWAQKQAALKTAGNLRNDPSKVSMSDMRSAASTANNFRERHGEQAAAGWKKANGLNQKYGITNKVNSFAGSSTSTAATASPPPQSPSTGGFKKPAPPPPPKKKELGGGAEPPPIPLSSKPKF